jgi:hypothetical protein
MRPPRPLSFVFHFSFRALPRKCVKTGHVQNMVRFQASGGVEECAARIVVFTFHNVNYSRKNGQ